MIFMAKKERKDIPKKNNRKRNAITGVLITIIAISSGLLAWLFILNLPVEPEIKQWNVVIDGKWDGNDTWIDSYNIHAQYIVPNCSAGHERDYNYFYIHNDNEWIYILIDLTSDTTKDLDEDWLAVFLWTRGLDELGNEIGCGCANYSQLHEGFEYFVFNRTIEVEDEGYEPLFIDEDIEDQFPETARLDWDDHEDWIIDIKEGFQATENSDNIHVIYEMKLSITALSFEKNGQNMGLDEVFYVGFLGYGTMAYFYGDDSWYAPSEMIPLCPYSFFECARVGEDPIRDLDTTYDEANPGECPDCETTPPIIL